MFEYKGMVSNIIAAAAVLATAIHLGGYAAYSLLVHRGHSRPNMATWVLWVSLSALNCASYFVMSDDLAKAGVAFAGAFASTATFVFSLKRGRMSRLNSWDTVALAFGLLAAGVWIALRSATYANIILQCGFIISMIPTYRGVIKDHAHEKALPWFMWGTAYAINLTVVILRWNGHPADLIYPLQSLFTHTGVGVVVLTMSRRTVPVRVPV